MNRRQFIKFSMTAFATWQLAPIAPASPPSIPIQETLSLYFPFLAYQHIAYGDKPNVLLIILDDQNDWIGCLGGHPQAHTPNIDRLAQRGALFTHAYCPAPLCNPSRASLLSGLHPTTTGLYDNSQSFRQHLPTAVTLPQYFMTYGYHTLGAGKVFHAPDPISWREYYPSFENTICFGPIAGQPPLNGIPDAGSFDWGPVSVTEEQTCDGGIAWWSALQLARAFDQPFFLAIGIVQPHPPWYIPAFYFDLYPPSDVALPLVRPHDQDDVPVIGRQSEALDQWVDLHGVRRQAVAAYLAAVAFADAQVGRVLDALDAGPHAQNTVVVLCGDNGYHLGTKQHWEKWALWEEASHVPLIIALPGPNTGRQICTRIVSLLDLYPSLLDLCGLPAHPGLDGRTLLPLLADSQIQWGYPALISMGPERHAVRSERWRYIHYEDGSAELYDHLTDPWEWNNLANDPAYTAVLQEYVAWLPANPAVYVPG